MIEFVLVACLARDPEQCRTDLRLLTEMTLIQCMTSTQFLAADWIETHPGWRIQRLRCRVFDPNSAQL